MAIEPSKYETLYLVRPDISPEDLLTIQNRIEQSVAVNSGELIKFEKWAERDLAYRIENYTRGTYYIAVYAAEPGAITDIERYFNLSKNNVLRFMTVKYLEEQKPAAAAMSAPPQASEPENQTAFQTPSLTPEEQSPGSEEQSPGSEEQSSGSEEQSPGSEEQSPGSEEQSPGSEEQSSGSEEQSPGSEEQSPGSEEPTQEDEEKTQGGSES